MEKKEVFKVKFFGEIYKDMLSSFFGTQDEITSAHEGSGIASIFEAVARELERLYIDAELGMHNNLSSFIYSFFGHEKKKAVKATGKVYFESKNPALKEIEIPKGLVVSTVSGIQFELLDSVLIPKGENKSPEVEIRALKSGEKSNVHEGEISLIDSYIAGVDIVKNDKKTDGGLDEENDFEYQKRFKNFLEGLGVCEKAGILNKIEKINEVYSVKILEHIPPLGGYNFSVIACAKNGKLTEEKKKEVKAVIDENSSCGINGNVREPDLIQLNNVKIKIWKKEGILEPIAVEATKKKIQDIFSNLKIGEKLNINVVEYELISLDEIENAIVEISGSSNQIVPCSSYQLLVLGDNLKITSPS